MDKVVNIDFSDSLSYHEEFSIDASIKKSEQSKKSDQSKKLDNIMERKER